MVEYYIKPSRMHRILGDQARGRAKWNAMAKQKPMKVTAGNFPIWVRVADWILTKLMAT
jgi:hypothetical protein